jgi:hypothetical protein
METLCKEHPGREAQVFKAACSCLESWDQVWPAALRTNYSCRLMITVRLTFQSASAPTTDRLRGGASDPWGQRRRIFEYNTEFLLRTSLVLERRTNTGFISLPG